MHTENELSRIVINHALHVHKILGPGLLESAYENCLFHSLSKTGLYISQEHPIPVIFENIRLECGYRADLIIENKLIVEIKAVEAINEVHKAQLLTYLRLKNYKLGLLINFNVVYLKDGVKRMVNGL
jgi:GxxExxY protein